MKVLSWIIAFVKKHLYTGLAAGIIAGGWGWYHLVKHNHLRFVIIVAALSLAVFIAIETGLYAYHWLVRRFSRHPFWQKEFQDFLPQFIFLLSLFFLIFFSKNELLSLGYAALLFPFIFWRVDRELQTHPNAGPWLSTHRHMFAMGYFVFWFQALCQYASYHYYILDADIKYFNIVVFRVVSMTGFWLIGFALASFIYQRLPRYWRYAGVTLWGSLFIFNIIFWVANISVLYFSGLYFSPVIWDHRGGGEGVAENNFVYLVIAVGIIALLSFIYVLVRLIKAQSKTPARYWSWYQSGLIAGGLFFLLGLSSFRTAPERVVLRTFMQRWQGTEQHVLLPVALQKKMQRFGLNYNPEASKPAHRETLFTSSTQKLLPSRLQTNHPNIVILLLESFSARMTGVYNPRFADLTPGFNTMAADPNTTVFHNYFNGSTPTITGTLSQLCSFLPPTGHNEIQNDRKLQAHHLLCFPELLKRQGGYKEVNYLTAVDKDFAHKDGIFTSAGVDKVYGTDELKDYISGAPLAWGYSDHQLFPAVTEFLAKSPEPSVTMLATVDTHPPFDLAKDTVPYGDGKQLVLNSFHTTDDAFLKFWQGFKASRFASNTIVIAVADHAIFPAALTTDLFAKEAKQLSYYDENFFLMYVPDTVLPKQVTTTASSIDVAPTLLHMLGINAPSSFEGYSIFADRQKYPNVVGMHELGLYINEAVGGRRKISYDVPGHLECAPITETSVSSTAPLTECELLQVYKWKREMFETGRWWEN